MNRALVAIAILLLAGVVAWLSSEPDSAAHKMPGMPDFAVSKVTSIRISGASAGPLEIRQSEGQWRFPDGVKVDSDAVNHLLGDLASMRIVRVVTRSSDHDAELGFGSSVSEVVLSNSDGAVLFRVDIGKQGKDLISTYVRVGEEKTVLAVDKTLLWQVHRGREGWLATDVQAVDTHLNP